MKASFSPHLLWAMVAVVTFVAGFWIGTPTAAEREKASPSLSQPSQRAGSAQVDHDPVSESGVIAHDGTPSIGGRASSPATGAEAQQIGYRLIANQMSRVARAQQLGIVLSQVTPENWRDILNGFERAMSIKNIGGGETYSILLEHIGAVAGPDALKDALTPEKVGDHMRFNTILKGWADADPKACLAWYQTQPTEIQKGYLGHFVAGLARNDPKSALELTFRPESAFLGSGTATAVVNNAVSVLGVQAVEDLFLGMRNRQDLAPTAKRAFFSNLLNKELPYLAKANEPALAVLEWFKNHVGQDYALPSDTQRIIGQAAGADPVASISWLELDGGRLTPEQASAGYQAVGAELQKQAPQKFEEWLATRPTDPHRDNMIEGAIGGMIQTTDFPGALKMAAAIGNESTRLTAISRIRQVSDVVRFEQKMKAAADGKGGR